MAHLRMELLGGLRVSLDGAPLTMFESNKVRALLAYLATEAQRPHSRETLAALLWPDWPDRAALNNLRYALADLRKVTGDREAEPPFLLISREAIQFNAASDHRLDVAEFAYLAGSEETDLLEQAVKLYMGDFLEGFSVSEAAPFEAWARLKGEQLHRAYIQGLHRLVAILESNGELERALVYARQQVEIEPLDESAQRQLMRLLALNGRRTEALVQYAACRGVLLEELRAEPSGETTRLYEQILAGHLEGQTPAIRVTSMPRPPAALDAIWERERPVFVAREAEMEQLDALLHSALGSSGQVAFIAGDAGRGKTALLREFASHATEAHPDLLVAAGGCNPYSGVGDPYLPLRSMLRMLMGNVELAWSSGMLTQVHLQRLWQAAPLAFQALLSYGSLLVDTFIPGVELLTQAREMGIDQAVLRQIIEKAAEGPTQLAQQHLFEQYCGVLLTLSRDRPLLLLLDDLQWSDVASAALLYHMVTRLDGRRILVLCAYRPEEVAIGRDGEHHPLEKTLAEIKRRYRDAWLDLGEGHERQGRRFVDAFLDSEPNRLSVEFRERLFLHTQGHALFTVELLRAMQERGDLVRDAEGNWVAGPVLDMDNLPTRVESAIAERIGLLSEELRQTISIASVEGEEFTAQVTARVMEVDERQMLRQLSQDLEKRYRLVREQGELQSSQNTLSRYRFAHALFQQYLYNQLGGPERRLLHRLTAQALEGLHAGDVVGISPQLAYHWQQAKYESKTRDYMLMAGQEALAAFANPIAEDYFRQALELIPTEMQRAALLAGLGEALRRQAQREEAVQVLRQGIELYRQLGELDGMANLYPCLSQTLHRDNHLDAWNACQEGLQLLQGASDSPGFARLLAEAGRTAHFIITRQRKTCAGEQSGWPSAWEPRKHRRMPTSRWQ